MPSGTREDEDRICKICNNKLRPLYKNEDWEGRKYHVACFKGILKDIMNYHKICYKKYNHKKKVHDVFVDEMPKDHTFVITWD